MNSKSLFLAALLLATSACAQDPHGIFVVGGSGGGPQGNSIPAAALTAGKTVGSTYTAGNALCDAVTPFYWEIGDQHGALGSGSVTKTGQTGVLQATRFPIASATKMIYHIYVAQLRTNASAPVNATDISYLNMTAGYSNLGAGDGTGASCPKSLSPRTVSQCLTQINNAPGAGQGQRYDWQNPADVGHFNYNGAQFEVHGRDFGALSGLNGTNAALNNTVVGLAAGLGTNMQFSQPLLAGGLYSSAADYALALRGVLAGGGLRAYLGTNEVCANPGHNYSTQLVNGVPGPASCDATESPITEENWQYGLGNWLISDPATNGDRAFCSPGSFGFDPCIDASKTYYFILSRKSNAGSGYASERCNRLIRRAFITGTTQTGSIPTP